MTVAKPYFSVVIPTLNEEENLPKLLDSLCAQTITDFEVIVSDGSSEDDTVSVARGYIGQFKKHSVRLTVQVTKRTNVARQRNAAVAIAKGSVLIFFDADVWFKSGYLEKLQKQLAESGADCATTRYHVDSHHYIAVLGNLTFIIALAVGRVFFPGYCFVTKKQAFQEVGGFRDNISLAEDYDLSRRLGLAGFKCKYFWTPVLMESHRRMRTQGGWSVLKQYAKLVLLVLFKGDDVLQTHEVEYKMGGTAHKPTNTSD